MAVSINDRKRIMDENGYIFSADFVSLVKLGKETKNDNSGRE